MDNDPLTREEVRRVWEAIDRPEAPAGIADEVVAAALELVSAWWESGRSGIIPVAEAALALRAALFALANVDRGDQ